MSQRKIYRPGVVAPQRRQEWVSLDGGDVCVWELTVAESTQILERSERPKVDPRGGHNRGMTVVTQILLSCFDGEEDGAKRIFADHDLAAIYALPFHDFQAILSAMNRVNGTDADEEERLRDFSTATGAPNPSE